MPRGGVSQQCLLPDTPASPGHTVQKQQAAAPPRGPALVIHLVQVKLRTRSRPPCLAKALELWRSPNRAGLDLPERPSPPPLYGTIIRPLWPNLFRPHSQSCSALSPRPQSPPSLMNNSPPNAQLLFLRPGMHSRDLRHHLHLPSPSRRACRAFHSPPSSPWPSAPTLLHPRSILPTQLPSLALSACSD